MIWFDLVWFGLERVVREQSVRQVINRVILVLYGVLYLLFAVLVAQSEVCCNQSGGSDIGGSDIGGSDIGGTDTMIQNALPAICIARCSMASETSSGCTRIQAKALVNTEGISAIAATKKGGEGGGGGGGGVNEVCL